MSALHPVFNSLCAVIIHNIILLKIVENNLLRPNLGEVSELQ